MKINKHILLVIILFQPITILAQSEKTRNNCKSEKVELWREFADEGKYKEAIKELEAIMQENKHAFKHRDYWHIGQMYACDNDYKNAIFYLKKSTNIFDRLIDREWRLYYKGTIAFLRRDKEKLKICYNKLWSNHSYYSQNNAFTLKALYENFDKPYREANKLPVK